MKLSDVDSAEKFIEWFSKERLRSDVLAAMSHYNLHLSVEREKIFWQTLAKEIGMTIDVCVLCFISDEKNQ